ncbi:MAG: ABC transporter permease [Acidobacteriia bacterium]|nr:ABC transporter permease [Terriglobia bacterium]
MGFLQELRFAARMLLKNRGWTAVAALALALGIGANIAIFSVVGLMIWFPLPYPNAADLVYITQSNPQRGFNQASVSLQDTRDWASASGIASIAAYQMRAMALTGAGEAQRLIAMPVTPEFFAALGVRPAVGRAFTPAESPETESRVAVISDELWQTMFRGDGTALGRNIRLDGRNYAIVGVMPKGFHFLYRPADVWIPLSLNARNRQRSSRVLGSIARLRPGTSVRQASAEIRAISERIEQQDTEAGSGWRGVAHSMSDILGTGARAAAKSMFGAMGFVLLIACANVASLLLARGSQRRRELALRASLGAGRGALIRLQLIESVLLSAIGGALGLVSAFWTIPLLKRVAPPDMTFFQVARLDWSALGFGLALSLVTGIAFGALPAWLATRGDLAPALQEASRGSSGGRHVLLKSMVVAEMALAMTLVAASTLMIRSVVRQTTVDPGFDKANLVSGMALVSLERYSDAQAVDLYRRVLETARRDGRLESAAAVNTMPLGGANDFEAVTLDSESEVRRKRFAGDMVVSPGYFQTMRIPLLSGRDFAEADTASSADVAIVNQAFVRFFWPKEANPVGRRLKMGDGPGPWCTVVGVARDVRHMNALAPPRPEVYRPYTQSPSRYMNLVARGHASAQTAGAALRAAVFEADRELPLLRMMPVEEQLYQRNAGGRATAQVLAGLAAIALILAAVGTYGVMAYTAARRVREIGIRLALGATPDRVFRIVLRGGLTLALAGIAIGLPAAYGTAPLLRAVDPGVDARDGASYLWMALLLMVVALTACAAPAWRAMRTDPARVLRNE